MKKIILLLLPITIFAQKEKEVKFNFPMGDKSYQARSVQVIDLRKNKEIGTISYDEQKYTLVFPKLGLEKTIKDSFYKDNKDPEGDNHYLLALEEMTAVGTPEEKDSTYTNGTATVKAAVFLKKKDSLYFVTRLQDKETYTQRKDGNIPSWLCYFLGSRIADLMMDSYKTNALTKGISNNDLPNYYTILFPQTPLTKAELPTNAVYNTAEDFLNAKPKTGFTFEKDEKKQLIKAIGKDEKIPVKKIYAYTEDGKTYIKTPLTFLELEKDENGYFVFANRNIIYPPQVNSMYYGGGLVGGIAVSMEINSRNKKSLASDRTKVYLDPITGKFLF